MDSYWNCWPTAGWPRCRHGRNKLHLRLFVIGNG
jgi:hypothetical protein